MNARLARFLTKLYPRAWRERYGEEFAALLEEQSGTPLIVLNVLAGALRESVLQGYRDWADWPQLFLRVKVKRLMGVACILTLLIGLAVAAEAAWVLAGPHY